MVAELAAAAVAILMIGTELLHASRSQRVAVLAFGPQRRPAVWTWLAAPLRIIAASALCWGLVTLMVIEPKIHKAQALGENQFKHVMLVLDVSPSMRLDDAGPEHDQQRMKRASAVMESFFKRVAISQFRISVVAVYNGAKSVVVDTKDIDVVRNILSDLPLHHAFQTGPTELFTGLEEAAKIARPWKPRSTTIVLISDGDTVPATGMPKMPASIGNVLVVGVGDPKSGSFIAGRQSRQDVSTLRQIALRLGGEYHNGNEKHLPSALLKAITQTTDDQEVTKLTLREYALLAIGIGAMVLAFIPMVLHYYGTAWRPGVHVSPKPLHEASRGIHHV